MLLLDALARLLAPLRWHVLPLAQDGTLAPNGAPGSSEEPMWLQGLWEVDFVLVSLLVGAVGILLVVHLARRITIHKDPS